MPKQKKTAPKTKLQSGKNRRVLWGVGPLVILCLLVFVLRGWVRTTILPAVVTPFYASSVQNTLGDQSSSLGDPFAKLGLTKVNKSAAKCSLELAQSYHTEIDCFASWQSYTKLPAGAAGTASIQGQAKALQSSLITKGWQAGSNGVTLTGLVDGTAHGIDYSPDANYEKITGKTDCVFDVMIAYANPQPPAIRSTLSCDRTLNVLGTPKGEFYNSSKGHI